MSFNKGYTLDGYADKVFHVHVHAEGDNDEISFRNYLMEDSATAREYEKLECSLLPKFRTDRDGYTAAKSEFVKSPEPCEIQRCDIGTLERKVVMTRCRQGWGRSVS